MRLSIACDHGGYELKEFLKQSLENEYEIIDNGCYSKESVDYPLYAEKVCKDVQNGSATYGILICTNGVGMSIVANKFKGIRAGLALNESMAHHAKCHNGANVLCLGQTNQPMEDAINMVKVFIATEPATEERHVRRVNQIKKYDEEN